MNTLEPYQKIPELYEEKLQFFTNVTHELGTPLTLISTPCERNLEYEGADEYIRKYAHLIRKHANRLHHFFLEIINEGTDYNTVTPRKDTVVQDLEAGKGTHSLDIRLFNATADFSPREVTLKEGEEMRINLTLQVKDTQKPFVALVVADGNTDTAAEISGAYY